MSEPYINFSCPICSKNYSTYSRNAGQKRTCTECSYIMAIPDENNQATVQNQQQATNLKEYSNSGSKYPYLSFYCGLMTFCSSCFLVLFLIGLILGISQDNFRLVNASAQIFGLALGGFAFAGIIQVLMDIEENTRKE